jgi:hypothetical protein
MSSRAISKLQTILLIDILIVSFAAAGYFYIASSPGTSLSPQSVQLTGLATDQNVVIGQPLSASVNITNTSSEKGVYSANLTIDNLPNQSKTIALSPGETQTVSFSVTGLSEGTHTVRIDSLEAAFTVLTTYEISDLAINRTTAKIGEPLGISVKITNQVNQTTNYNAALSINGAEAQTKSGTLDVGETKTVLFEVVEQNEGTYNVSVGSLNGNFTIAPSAPPAKPAEFQISNLIIDPDVAQVGIPINVTAKVTNVGEINGNYSATLLVNNAAQGSKIVTLIGGESTTILFTVTENVKAVYTVSIGNLTGNFSIQDPSTIKLTNMIVKPYEVWAGQMVTVTVKGTNTGTSVSTLSLKLKIDDITTQTQNFQVGPGADGSIDFTIVADPLQGGDSATHIVDVNGMQGGFMVVKNGYHTLNVQITPRGDAKFTFTYPNGTSAEYTTFWSALLPEGTYTATMPLTDPTGRISFVSWEDGSTSLAHTINLNARTTLTATYTGGSSCPSLYMWNGTGYVYVAEVSNHGWLGYMNYVDESDNGTVLSTTYWRNSPWDYIPLNASQLQPTNGNFNLTLTQRWDEIFFLDSAYMMVVDHPSDVNVYSTMVEQYINANYTGQIYTVSKNPLTPISAVNEKGENVLPQISKMDGVFTTGFNGKESSSYDNITWNRLNLNLGNLTGAPQIKLVLKAMVDFGDPNSYTTWINKFFSQPRPNGTQPTPIPYMEVKDANGNWVRVPDDRQFPLAPDGIARTYIVDLTGLFPTNDYSLRISNFWNVTYDYIGVDITPQANVTIQRIDPEAVLHQTATTASQSTGNFTKYGDVTQLLLNEDDEFVIGRQGDSVSLQFPTSNLNSPATGMERDYFFFVATWFKTEYANSGFGPTFGFTVDPLPFQNMSGFPYPLAQESYPFDSEHTNYLQQWNTRTINPPPAQQNTAPTGINQSVILVLAFAAVFITVNVSFILLRRRSQYPLSSQKLMRK